MAATYGVARRGVWVGSGVAVGFAGACIVAASAGAITAAVEGIRAGASQCLDPDRVAVIMLGWHTIWMSQHGREISREMGEIGKAVAAGNRPRFMPLRLRPVRRCCAKAPRPFCSCTA